MAVKLGSLNLKEEHRLRMFEKRVLKTILGSEEEENIRSWRKSANEYRHNLYCSPYIVR
jgi:hypothetical protein